MIINNINHANVNYYKQQTQSTKPQTQNITSTNSNPREDSIEITPQLNRANAQHLWVDVGGKQVSTLVTADGVWMAKNGGIGRDTYKLVDVSTMPELEYMSKMLAHMPSGQLSAMPASYGRSVMASMGLRLSDLTNMPDEQLQWLKGGDDMRTTPQPVASLKDILQELTNAFATVGEKAESAFLRMLGNNRGFLGVHLMQMNFKGDAATTNPAILEQMRIESERKIDLFGEVFISNFKELGAEKAFELAWLKLQ